MRSIPISWAAALTVAVAMALVLIFATATGRWLPGKPIPALGHVAHLLGGGVAGFTALAFAPAWPLLAAVLGMLTVRAARMHRVLDIGLMSMGFGFAWMLLVGILILTVVTDPAVHSPDQTGPFVVAVAIFLAGLTLTIRKLLPTNRWGAKG
jgi:hypothetical protein